MVPVKDEPLPAGIPVATESEELPGSAALIEAGPAQRDHQYVLTTGPFALPASAKHIDWFVLNNDVAEQTFLVTVYRLGVGVAKAPDPPGTISITVDAGASTHNANAAVGGFVYEIEIRTDSLLLMPYACAWPVPVSDPLPGSIITSSQWIRY